MISKLLRTTFRFQSIYDVSSSNRTSLHARPWCTNAAKSDLLSNIHPCRFCGKVFPNESVLNIHLGTYHSLHISRTLKSDPVTTYKSIFGEDVKRETTSELRYKGGLVVTLKGPKAGCWYSFTTGKGGGPLKAIQEVKGCTFQEALDHAAGMITSDDIERSDISFENKVIDGEENRIKTAENIWDQAVPLAGTLGERYLVRHRKIPKSVVPRLKFRFLGANSEYVEVEEDGNEVIKTNTTPAVVVPVVDEESVLTGVQRIFLDPKTGGKPQSSHKYSKGVIRGSAGLVQKGSQSRKLVIVEGPKTGASVAAALGKTPTIIAALSVANIASLHRVVSSHSARDVVFAADRDPPESSARQMALKAFEELQQKVQLKCRMVMPMADEATAKVDWNDVLRSEGVRETKRQLVDVG